MIVISSFVRLITGARERRRCSARQRRTAKLAAQLIRRRLASHRKGVAVGRGGGGRVTPSGAIVAGRRRRSGVRAAAGAQKSPGPNYLGAQDVCLALGGCRPAWPERRFSTLWWLAAPN